MPARDADRNLLFGILALQMGFITREALIDAMSAWVLEKRRPIGDILVDRGSLDPFDRAALDPMIARHLARHGGDPAASLAALSSIETDASALRQSIADPDFLESLATIAPTRAGDFFSAGAGAAFDPPPPAVRYTKVRDHAKGGLGVVFVARDEELKREVALKEIQERHADDPASRARFLIEAEVTGGLEHPGIVPVYGLGSYEDGRPFYAMRFIKGDSLKDAITRFHADDSLRTDPGAQALALQKLLRRFLDVCNAVAYAHSRGVLHRDLKPDNVMVGMFGETLVVDWGLAKTTGQSGGDSDTTLSESALSPASASGSNETLPGSVIGTPAYMSPEQAAGRLDLLGPASDVYSLGATLYTLLTGRAPFSDRDVAEVLRKVERGAFPRPREATPWLDPALEAVCLKAMALRPETRYPSPKALADDVDRWVAGEPVACWKEPVVRKLRRWVGRNRILVTGSVSLMATAVVALVIAVVVINGEKSKVTLARDAARDSAKVAEAARDEARASAKAAEAARRNEAASAEEAKAAAAKVLGVINVLVNTFRASDPIGLEGMGVRVGSEATRTLNAGDLLDRSAKLVETSLGDQPLVQATLMDTIGDVYRSMAELDKAGAMLRSAKKIREERLTPDDPDLSTTLVHLGWLHQDKGEFDESERLFLDALTRRTARFGASSAEALDARFHLALLWMFEEDYGKAEPALREVIEKLGKVKGEDHRDVAIARLMLAASLLNEQRFPEAVLLSNRALNALLSKAQAEQIFRVIGKFNQGFVFHRLKAYTRADQAYRDGLGIAQQLLGPDHPYLTFFFFEMGINKEDEGDLRGAETAFRQALDLGRRTIGLAHPKATKCVSRLARLLASTGRFDEARTLCEELLATVRKAYGREHVWVADALVGYSEATDRHGDRAATERLLREALTIYRGRREHFPVSMAACLNNLANRRLNDGDAREAETLLREVLPLAQKQYGPNSHNVGVVLKNLARALCTQGQDGEESDRLYAESLVILRSALDNSPDLGVNALAELATSQSRRGRLDLAERYSREALESSRQVFRKDPAERAYFAKHYAGILMLRGEPGRAIPPLEEAVTLYRSTLPGGRANLVQALSLSALAHATAGNLAASRERAALPLREFATTDDPVVLHDMTWAVSRFAGTIHDRERLESLGRRVLAEKPADRSHRVTGSAALLRAGQIEEAARRLEELRRDEKSEPTFGNLFLAIAYHKLGQPEQAEAARNRAITSIDQPGKVTRSWNASTELRILREEVETLFRETPGALPANVFRARP